MVNTTTVKEVLCNSELRAVRTTVWEREGAVASSDW